MQLQNAGDAGGYSFTSSVARAGSLKNAGMQEGAVRDGKPLTVQGLTIALSTRTIACGMPSANLHITEAMNTPSLARAALGFLLSQLRLARHRRLVWRRQVSWHPLRCRPA